MTLVLDAAVHDAIRDHASDGAPEEVCGVLGGTYGELSRATSSRRVTNVAARPRMRYELDAVEQFCAMEAVEEAGDDVVGFYHSHPRGPAAPSATDASLATWDDYSYVVVVPHGRLGSWRWRGDEREFEREGVRVEGEDGGLD